jgi:predicted acyltransferase
VFKEINDRFHYSLIDTPAVSSVADIGLIAPLCHSVLIVIRMNRTPEPLLRRSVKMLQANHVPITGCILAGYAAIQLLVPVPGIGAGVLTPEGCINGYIDRMFMPGKLYGGSFTPEGYLCILSATGITMMGYMAGHLLKKKDETSAKKIKMLSMIGIGLIILALILHPFYPVIKNCWTTTFNLLAGGISFLLLAIFYFIIDVKKWRNWAFFFIVIGMNSIFIYLFKSLVNIEFTSKYLLGWLAGLLGETGGSLVIISGGLALSWLLLYFMYLKKIFIKV